MAQKITIDIDGDITKLQAAIAQANGALSGLGAGAATGARLKSTGKVLTAAVTLPLVGIAAQGVKTAADFEVSMASIGVNAGIGGEQLQRLGDLAIQLGADTVFSANEAAEAMLELSKAGISPAAIESGVLANTLNLAATEGIGLVEASTIMANTMNAFGLEAENTGKIVDILASGAVASTAGVADLAGGLKYVGATAKSLSIPLDDTVTALAALNNAGIDSTTAGTSLNRFFLGLTGGSEKARKAMQELGISFEDANGNLLPMEEILPVLSSKIEGMGEATRIQTLKTLFGVEGMRAANVLLGLNADGYSKLKEEVNQNGTAAELANARMSGMAGALEQLRGSAETAALKIGNALEPVITLVSKALTIAINLFTALPGPIQTVVVGIGAFAAVLGPILFLMGAIQTSTNLATGALLAKNAALKIVTAAQWLFNAAMSANPIGLVIIAIAAIIAIIVLLVKNWDTVTEVVGKVWDAIKDFAQKAWDKIKEFVENVIEKFQSFKDKVGQIWSNIKDKIGELVQNIINKIKELPSKMLDIGEDVVRGLWNGMKNMLGWLKNKVTDLFGDVVGFAKKALGIRSPSKVFGGIGKNIAQGLWTGLKAEKTYLKNNFEDFFGDIIPTLTADSLNLPDFSDFVTLEYLTNAVENSTVDNAMLAGVGLDWNAGTEQFDIDDSVVTFEKLANLVGSDSLGSTYNITVNAGTGTDPYSVGRAVTSAIDKYSRISSVPGQRVTL
jgi:TP901 family phage tail tape measure protein